MKAPALEFGGRRVTIMGLGRHGGGLGVAKWLLRQGAVLTVTDLAAPETIAQSIKELDRLATQLGRPVRYVLGRHDEADFTGAQLIIRNPAVPRDNRFLKLASDHGVPVESDISLLFRLCPHPLTGITGSKGKTTVATLLAAIAKEHDARTVVGGNMRLSPFDWLDRVARMKRPPPIILELSSWQLEDLEHHRLSPHVGIITNILRDHLNRYGGSMDEYARAKELIIVAQRPEDVAVLNIEDERLRLMRGAGQRFWFGRRRPAGFDGCFVAGAHLVVWTGGKKTVIMPLREIRLPGQHNHLNVAAAIAAALAMGIPKATIRRAIKNFRGVPGRLEAVATIRRVKYVNDTTATIPDASVVAMEALSKKRNLILIAGGADKDLLYEAWAKAVAKHVRQLVLFPGAATDKMTEALDRLAPKVPRVTAPDMKSAVRLAAECARRGDTVLLSPAAASFGLFQHEFDRGDKFLSAVRALTKKR